MTLIERWKSAIILIALLALPSLRSPAAPNNWTNTGSGLWRFATNWSLATLPNSTSAVDPTQITNANTKTVTVDSATASTNLSLRGLTISAPAGSTNTLLVASAPVALTTSRAFLISNRGALQITNSDVWPGLDFDIVNGTLIMDSGSLTCAQNCDLQAGSMIVNSGTLTATSSVTSTGIRLGRFNGANASLVINGGTVDALRLTLGSVSGSQCTLAIAGGNLISHDSLSFAQSPATSGNATLSAGNLFVTNGTTKIADRATATFTHTGGNAYFANLSVGDLGFGTYNLGGGQMTVTPRTTNDLIIVGNAENGAFNQTGGVAIIRSEFHVADNAGITGDILISGGQFFATNDLVAIGRYGLGGMIVSNATVVLTNVSVGRHDTGEGTLRVRNDASLWLISDLSIGRLTNATGHVFVEGGLLSLTNDTIWVGRGGIGDFTVSSGNVRAKELFIGKSEDGTNTPSGSAIFSGGVTVVSSNCVIGASLISTGAVSVAGGSVYITNATGTASLAVNQGTITLTAGILQVDTLTMATNTGQFVFNSGNLRTRSMSVANGDPFVVGDGVNAATLELQGGTFSFADGLVISPNATVTGCGTIIGPITNNGVYSNSCGVKVTIKNITKVANTATIYFSTIAGSNHVVEYKTNLLAPTWIPLLPGVIGDGNTMSKADTSAANSSRFYRISVQ